MDPALGSELEALARTPVLLVASDYDGTLAPIVEDPSKAFPEEEAVLALRRLSQLALTHTAVISGRALRDLRALANLPAETHVVGSHGSEFDTSFESNLTEEHLALRARLFAGLEAIAAEGEGLAVEPKPASAALHYRRAERDAGRRAAVAAEGLAAQLGLAVRRGKEVVELLLFRTNKGDALDRLRQRVGATAVLFLGDDLTDEDAFRTLTGPDVGVLVGDRPSAAAFRVDDPRAVAALLGRLTERREAWLAGGDAVPLERHSVLSDQRTVAVVGPNARVSWLCLPRLDSPAVFAELLGGPEAGTFAVEPADGAAAESQAYRPGTLTLETRFPTFTVTDFLDCSQGRPTRRAGRSDLIRIVEGAGRARLRFAPRLDFGRVPTRLALHEVGLRVEGSIEPFVLRSPRVAWTITRTAGHDSAEAEVDLARGPVVLDLRYGTASLGDSRNHAPDRRAVTDAYWSDWAARLSLPTLAREQVERSALLLRSLCHPSGAIAAAATTSLPEVVGGVRNWDYRFCWPRDAAIAAASLVRLGSTDEAMAFLDWLLPVIEGCAAPSNLAPLYGLGGEAVPAEAEIGGLAGYRGSRPVRVSNMAARQVQMDVFGPVAQLVLDLVRLEAPLSTGHWKLVEDLVGAVGERWTEPDHGIWEIRDTPRHHVHSKVQCWVTVDRACEIARLGLDRERDDWKALRDRIAAEILERGWNERVGAFTAAYEADDLDAAALTVGTSGLVAPTDDRFRRTVEAVERELRVGPTVYRYRRDDGLPGLEGGFLLCAGWLAEAYRLAGRTDDARAVFESLLALAGPTGVLTEQYDPKEGVCLGNLPQAYSHATLIDNAVALDALRAERSA